MGEIKMASLSSGRAQEKESLVPSVKHVIAVSSGKGGVGKVEKAGVEDLAEDASVIGLEKN